jgi:hypothetical protein
MNSLKQHQHGGATPDKDQSELDMQTAREGSGTSWLPDASPMYGATTVAWGRNEESGHDSNAVLIETNLTLKDRDSWFGRFEAAGKTAHDLAIAETEENFTLGKLQGGYTHYLPAWKGLKPGIGISVGRLRSGTTRKRVRQPH